MCSPSIKRRARFASRCSSSAAATIGATAPISRAPTNLPAEEVLESFIAQFYDDKPPPKLILLSHDIATAPAPRRSAVARAGHKVGVMLPQRGEKRELVMHALANAREALARRLAEYVVAAAILTRLAELFDLDEPPERIEVYDNSHISGTNPVGAMIVAGPKASSKGNIASST